MKAGRYTSGDSCRVSHWYKRITGDGAKFWPVSSLGALATDIHFPGYKFFPCMYTQQQRLVMQMYTCKCITGGATPNCIHHGGVLSV